MFSSEKIVRMSNVMIIVYNLMCNIDILFSICICTYVLAETPPDFQVESYGSHTLTHYLYVWHTHTHTMCMYVWKHSFMFSCFLVFIFNVYMMFFVKYFYGFCCADSDDCSGISLRTFREIDMHFYWFRNGWWRIFPPESSDEHSSLFHNNKKLTCSNTYCYHAST